MGAGALVAAVAGLGVWLAGGAGQASADPGHLPAGLTTQIPPERFGRTTTRPTLQCPATPPTSCADYRGDKDMGIVDDRTMEDIWTVPGDVIDFHAAYIACLPTNGPNWTQRTPEFVWKTFGYPNPGLRPDDRQPTWRFNSASLPTFPVRNSEGDWSTNSPMTSDWTIDPMTRQMHNEQVVSVAPQANEDSLCGTRTQTYSISVQTPSIYLMVFDPEITLKKYVCLPGKDCSGTDTSDATVWADAGTEDAPAEGDEVPGPYLNGQSVTWLIEVTNTGTVDLENVRIPANDPTELGDQLSGVMEGHETTCEGLVADTLLADPKGDHPGVAYMKCTTTLDVPGTEGGTLRNDVQALADVLPTPAMAERVGSDTLTVRSNSDPAAANVVVPKLELVKEVCIHADPSKCELSDDSAWVAATWPLDGNGDLIANPLTPPVAGVDYPVIPKGKDATWRITVTNIGETDLADVHLSADVVSGGGKAAGDSDCLAVDPGAPMLKAGANGAPGDSYSFSCATPDIQPADGPTINKAQATSTAVEVIDGEVVPYTDSDGNDIAVDSNVDSATIDAYRPELKLKKYACKTGTGCDPAKPDEWLDTGGDPTLEEGDDGYEPYDPKDRVWVESGQPIQWLIVATNTGNVALAPVTLTDELSGATTGDETNECANGTHFPLAGEPAMLIPGASASLTCTTSPVVENADNSSLTNTAQAHGTLVDEDGKLIPEAPAVDSNHDMANVAAATPALTLKKYACVTGTGCTEPASAADAARILANDDDEWSDAQDSDHSVMVASGAALQWLVLVENTGTASLKSVTLAKDVLTIGGIDNELGAPGCEPGDVFATLDVANDVLAPGGYSYLTCSTTVNATDPVSDVVNTATASGQALNPDYPDGDVPLFADADDNTVTSDPDPAYATAASPKIDLSKWVCKAGETCAPDDFKSDTDHGSWVKATDVQPGGSVEWLIVVSNSGNVDLSGVTLSSENITAAGAAARASEGEACALAFGQQPIAAGSFVARPCPSSELATAEAPLVNTASATGRDPFGQTVNSLPDSAEVRITDKPAPPVGPPTSATSSPAASSSLPFTGMTLGVAGLAAALLCVGAAALWLRRGRRTVGARHAAP